MDYIDYYWPKMSRYERSIYGRPPKPANPLTPATGNGSVSEEQTTPDNGGVDSQEKTSNG